MTASVASPIAEPTRSAPARLAWRTSAAAPWLLALAVFLASAWVRLDGIDLVLTADEGYWVHRTVRFAAAVAAREPERTFRTGHPGVTVMWVGTLGIGWQRLAPFLPDRYVTSDDLERAPGYSILLDNARRGIAVVVAGLMAAIVLLAWRLLGPVPAMVGGGLLAFDPYVVGMTRLLHVDALLAPLMTISALCGLIYWTQSGRWPYLLLSGLAGGLALLTKAPAGYLPIFFALIGLVMVAAARRRPTIGGADQPALRDRWPRPFLPPAFVRTVLAPVVLWGVVAGLVYVALFPALWVAPVQRVQDLIAFLVITGLEPHPTNYFLGHVMRDDPGFLYYLVVMPLRASPLVAIGLAGLAFNAVEGERRGPSRWLVLYAVLFAVLMTVAAKKLDRYMLPSLLVLDLLAGVGLWRLATHLSWAVTRASVRAWAGRLAGLLLGACILGQGALLLLTQPYPLAYYNPFAGGPQRAAQLIMVGWGEGLEQVTGFLNQQPNAHTLRVATNYSHVVQPRFEGTTIPINLYFAEAPVTPLPTPDYIVLYVNSVQRRQIPPVAQRAILAGPPAFVARIGGLEYAWVYAVSASEPRVDAPVPTDSAGEAEDR